MLQERPLSQGAGADFDSRASETRIVRLTRRKQRGESHSERRFPTQRAQLRSDARERSGAAARQQAEEQVSSHPQGGQRVLGGSLSTSRDKVVALTCPNETSR